MSDQLTSRARACTKNLSFWRRSFSDKQPRARITTRLAGECRECLCDWLLVASRALYQSVNGGGLNSQPFYLESVFKALALSVALHLAIFLGSELGDRLAWWKHTEWGQRSKLADQTADISASRTRQKSLAGSSREVSIVFVEIDPDRAVAPPSKAPKPADAKNTETTQPEKPAEPKQVAIPAQPPSPPVPVPAQATPASQTASKTLPDAPSAKPPPPGDTSSTDSVPRKSETTPVSAARTAGVPSPAPLETESPKVASPAPDNIGKPALASAAANPASASVRRPTIEIDLKGKPFGNYDSILIAAVQKRWYELLDQRKGAREDSGRVVVEFRLKYDGHITDLKIARREVDFVPAWDCQRAVAESAPFRPWPREMHRIIAANYRSVRFTFVY